MKKIVGLIMAVTIALSLNACTFTGQSETSNMVDESVSVDQGGQVIRVDIPNGRWYIHYVRRRRGTKMV